MGIANCNRIKSLKGKHVQFVKKPRKERETERDRKSGWKWRGWKVHTIWGFTQCFTRHLPFSNQPHITRACHIELACCFVNGCGFVFTVIGQRLVVIDCINWTKHLQILCYEQAHIESVRNQRINYTTHFLSYFYVKYICSHQQECKKHFSMFKSLRRIPQISPKSVCTFCVGLIMSDSWKAETLSDILR